MCAGPAPGAEEAGCASAAPEASLRRWVPTHGSRPRPRPSRRPHQPGIRCPGAERLWEQAAHRGLTARGDVKPPAPAVPGAPPPPPGLGSQAATGLSTWHPPGLAEPPGVAPLPRYLLITPVLTWGSAPPHPGSPVCGRWSPFLRPSRPRPRWGWAQEPGPRRGEGPTLGSTLTSPAPKPSESQD